MAIARGQPTVSIGPMVVVGVLGLLVGSFLNVCIYRLPRHESVNWPGSHCTSCQRPLAWYENIPLFSWLVLRGRCRTCRAWVSAQYPLVELATSLAFLGCYWVYGLTPLFAVRLVFACALIVLFVIDLQHQILPNRITLPGLAIGLILSLLFPPGWRAALLGAFFGGVFPWLVAEGYLRLRGREGMGMGDFKMLAMAGAFLGWPLIYIVLMLACVLGVVLGGGALLLTRRDAATRIAFGTFIAAASLAGVLAGPEMMAAYDRAIAAYLEMVER
jgi:leader peptidase (prepilin peptidase)/N-methyltransferase